MATTSSALTAEEARKVERERCASIAERIAEMYKRPDGKRSRGSTGAKQVVAEKIAELIRQD